MLFPVSLSPGIMPSNPVTVSNVFNISEINKLNNYINTLPYENARILEGKGNIEKSKQRRSKIKWLIPNPNLGWLYEKIHQISLKANHQWEFDIAGINESIQYTEYDSQNLDHFGWHLDLGGSIARARKISITIQLSNPLEYEGGNLEVFTGGDYDDPNNRRIAPKEQYSATIFPSYVLHRVTPVTKGIRKSLVIWVGGIPFR